MRITLLHAVPLMGLLTLGTSTVSGASQLLNIPVVRFEFHGRSNDRGHIWAQVPGGMSDAGLALAFHTNIRICVEELPSGSPRVPIEISMRDATVQDILNEMMRQDPRYEYAERSGVIEILPVNARSDASNCLNTVVPSFRVDGPWNAAWRQVGCQLLNMRRPRQGSEKGSELPRPCSDGGSHLGHPPSKVLTASFNGMTLRDILIALCSMAGDVGWYANYQSASPGCGSLRLSDYQPTGWYEEDPHGPNRIWVHGLPTRCLSCHYHQGAARE
jgi:hypothetical protein